MCLYTIMLTVKSLFSGRWNSETAVCGPALISINLDWWFNCSLEPPYGHCWYYIYSYSRPTCSLRQSFSIPVLATPRSAYFACLSYLTHLIQITSSLEESSMHELCCDWQGPTGCSSLSVLLFTSLQNIHSLICVTAPPAASSHTEETY